MSAERKIESSADPEMKIEGERVFRQSLAETVSVKQESDIFAYEYVRQYGPKDEVKTEEGAEGDRNPYKKRIVNQKISWLDNPNAPNPKQISVIVTTSR
jgi:hypothetical protein